MRPTSSRRMRSFALVTAALLALAGRTSHAETVLLSSLDLSKATQGFGSPQADKSVDQHPITIAGQKFDHGFGTHSIGALSVNLKGGSTKFHAVAGIDDETKGKGSVEFSVYADGKRLWTSGIIKGGQPGKIVDLDITGVQHLTLHVGDAGDGYAFDHAVWADASFEVTGGKPETFKPVPREPVIANAPPAPTPEIHTPLVYGGKVGEPFLLTIPATGQEPLTFSAEGLPTGLQLDGATGIITGSLQTEGTTPVKIHVRNDQGTTDETLNLVAGGKLALTPPLGWNSYDGYGDSVTEAEMLDNAKAVAKILKPHGWQYVVVDYCWYDPKAYNNNPNEHAGAKLPIDEYGRLQPAVNRFPTADGGKGFKPLADAVHGMGLKFGIHIMRGIPRVAVEANTPILGTNFKAADAANTNDKCDWCPFMYGVKGATPAGQAWYDSIFKQYAQWGLDFVKVDDLTAPYHGDEVHAIHDAIAKCGRSIVFSTSPGETPIQQADHVGANANMWRATGDYWDTWHQLDAAFTFANRWSGHGGVGHWPDLDMLPLGHLSVNNRSVDRDRMTRFSKSEQVTMLTLWSMAPSPLMLGGRFTDADAWEVSLLTNDDVLAVNQDAAGKQGNRVAGKDGMEIWTRDLSDGSQAVALFNRTDEDTTIRATLAELGLDGKCMVRDLWQRKDLGLMEDHVETSVTPHGAVMLRISKAK
jgi:alpha-galactosidase